MGKKILIAVTNDLETDQRVFRVAKSFYEMGHNIELIGRILPNSKPLNFFCKTTRFKLWFNKQALFYANYNIRLFFYLLFHRYDVVISNDLDTLPACYFASFLMRKKIIYDSHEYFTEVPELINQKFQRNFWLFMERMIVPKLKTVYTVSESIAIEYKLKYNVDFGVIRNLPFFKYPGRNVAKSGKYTVIYQGALNMGRGIELMIESMKYIDNVELWIAGTGDIENDLKYCIDKLGLQEKVQLLGRVEPEKLFEITQQAHLGLSLEEDKGLNYRYALPNKLFDYIQARIPMIVSDLPEMRRIVETYKIGEILSSRDPKKLANQILEALNKKVGDTEIAANLENAARELCWENEQTKLIEHFNSAIKN